MASHSLLLVVAVVTAVLSSASNFSQPASDQWVGQSASQLGKAVPLDCERALKRTVAMLIGRLRAYGSRWQGWVADGSLQQQPRSIPRKHRNKKLLVQNQDGGYAIHPAILAMAQQLNLT